MHGVEFSPEKDIFRKTRSSKVAKVSTLEDRFIVKVYDVMFVHGTLYCVDLPDDDVVYTETLMRTAEKNSLVDYAAEIDTIMFNN
jgi:hypothetical protein